MSGFRLEVEVGEEVVEGVNQARTHLVLHVRLHLYLYLPPGHIRPMYRLLDVIQQMEWEGLFVNLKDQGMGVGLVVSHQRVQDLGRGRGWELGLEDLGSTLMGTGMDHSLLGGKWISRLRSSVHTEYSSSFRFCRFFLIPLYHNQTHMYLCP